MTPLEQAQAMLGALVEGWNAPEANRLDVTVTPDHLLAAVRLLDQGMWGYLLAITGLDGGVEAGVIEALYQFAHGAAVVTLRVRLPRGQPVVPSICAVVPYASVFERELSEMYGVTVDGTPETARLYLPDDWTEGIYPLRVDAELD